MKSAELKILLSSLKEKYVHASNILTKLSKKLSENQLAFLIECGERYKKYSENFIASDIGKAVKAWNEYANYVRAENKDYFTAQSKFESTILEESIFRLFSNIENDKIKAGSIDAYSNLYFSPFGFSDFKEKSNVKINTKDQDFAIYKQVEITVGDTVIREPNVEAIKTYVPVVAIECKTYLDKTMLEGSVATAEKIKNGNPYCRFCIVTERYEVDKKVDVKHSRIDQIYVLKKDFKKSNSACADIALDVVQLLCQDIAAHLDRKWSDVEENIKNKGIVL